MSEIQKRIIATEAAPAAIGPYSQGIAAGSLVLTNRDDWKAHALPTARRVMPFARAMREAGLVSAAA